MKKIFQPAVGLWLLFILLCGFVVIRSQFTADMSAFLPRNPSPRQEILIDQISEGFASRALIVGIEGVPPPVLSEISKSMGQQLREGTDFSSVSNGQRLAGGKDQEFLFGNRYLLSPAMKPGRMDTDGLRSAITDSLAEVGSSTGLFSKSLLGRDPTGESLEVIKRVIPSSQPSQTDGVWMNAGQTRALLLLQTKAQGSNLDAQETAHAAVRKSFAQAQAATGAQADRAVLKFSGPGVFAVNARATIKSEAARLSAMGTVMVLGLLWLIYRSVTTLLLGVIPVLTGAIAGVASVGLGFSSVHGMTLGFGITLIGEAVDYAIYLFVQYTPTSRVGEAKDAPTSHAFASSFWPTIRLGVITSIVGFSTLLFSGFTGLAQLGLFSIVGIVVAAVTTRFLLPAVLPDDFSVRQPKKLGPFLALAANNLGRLKPVAAIAVAVALTLLALRWDNLWSAELGGLSPVPAAAQQLEAELRADMGAPDAGLLVVVRTSSSEKALQLSEQVVARLQPLVSRGELGGIQAPSNFLPSQRTQAARQASLPDEVQLRQRVTAALEGLPLRPEKLTDFFADVARARAGPLLTRTDLQGSSMGLGLDALLNQGTRSPDQWTALIALQSPTREGIVQTLNPGVVNEALADLKSSDKDGVFLIELGNEARNVYKAYLHEAIVLTAVGFVAIAAVLLVTLRSWRRVVRIILPLLASTAIVAAALATLKGSLTLLNLVGLLLVIAIGSNYALFFDQRSRISAFTPANSDQNMLCSLFFANISTVLGFGLLAFSSVPVMSAIGLTVGSGTFLALVMSAIFALPSASTENLTR